MDRTRTPLLALLTAVLAAASLPLLVTSAGAASQTPRAAATAPAQDPAWVRLAHLAPGAVGMEVDVVPFSGSSQPDGPADAGDGTRVALDGVTDYGDVGDYRRIRAGFYSVNVRVTMADSSTPPEIVRTLQTKPGAAYTIAAFEGPEGEGAGPEDLLLQVLTDDLAPGAPDSARVRLIAGASDQPVVDVTAQGGPVVADGVRYGGVTGYADVPAGPWSLTTRPTGSTADPVVAGQVDLAAGSTYTVLLVDQGASRPVLSAVLDAAGMATAPVGGVATGAGGTAAPLSDRPAAGPPVRRDTVLLGTALLAGAVLAGPLLVRRRRSRVGG